VDNPLKRGPVASLSNQAAVMLKYGPVTSLSNQAAVMLKCGPVASLPIQAAVMLKRGPVASLSNQAAVILSGAARLQAPRSRRTCISGSRPHHHNRSRIFSSVIRAARKNVPSGLQENRPGPAPPQRIVILSESAGRVEGPASTPLTERITPGAPS
jgi:hypothetical protein